VVGYIALFVALAGTSYAGIASQSDKGEDGTIYACVTKRFDTLNLAGPGGKCPEGQRLISWNEEGPKGERGKRGKRGRRGPAGAAGGTTGSVTSVDTGFGLTGGPITSAGTIAADPSVLQGRVTGSCSGNEAAQAVAEDGTVSCTPFVKQVSAGTGLSGGPITDTGVLSIDPTQTQTRVGGSCGGGQAIQSVGQNGSVTCGGFATGSGAVLNSGVTTIFNGEQTTLLQANGFDVRLDCSDNTDAKIVVRAQPGNAGNVLATSVGLPFTVQGGLDGNAAPPTNSVVVGTTDTPAQANERGDFDIGSSTGPNAGKTLSGSFATFKFDNVPNVGSGCVGQATAIAS
jgi:hypothetical protein